MSLCGRVLFFGCVRWLQFSGPMFYFCGKKIGGEVKWDWASTVLASTSRQKLFFFLSNKKNCSCAPHFGVV